MRLPDRPDLEHLRKQAKARKRERGIALSAAQHELALDYGFPSWPRLVRQVAKNGGFAIEDIDFLIFTQVRKPTIELVMKDLGLPMAKTHTVMEKWGYTGSACIPMALHDALEEKKIRPGDLVVMIGSGVGYNQAAAAFRMPQNEKRLFG